MQTSAENLCSGGAQPFGCQSLLKATDTAITGESNKLRMVIMVTGVLWALRAGATQPG